MGVYFKLLVKDGMPLLDEMKKGLSTDPFALAVLGDETAWLGLNDLFNGFDIMRPYWEDDSYAEIFTDYGHNFPQVVSFIEYIMGYVGQRELLFGDDCHSFLHSNGFRKYPDSLPYGYYIERKDPDSSLYFRSEERAFKYMSYHDHICLDAEIVGTGIIRVFYNAQEDQV